MTDAEIAELQRELAVRREVAGKCRCWIRRELANMSRLQHPDPHTAATLACVLGALAEDNPLLHPQDLLPSALQPRCASPVPPGRQGIFDVPP